MDEFLQSESTPISHPFLPITSNPARKLGLNAIGSPPNLYIGAYASSGVTNRYRVTIDISSIFSNSAGSVTATRCYFESFSKASNNATSSSPFSFDLDTSTVSNN